MSLRTLAVLSWVGLFAGALVWAGQHVVGFGITHATCGGADLGISNDLWQTALLVVAVAAIALAEAAAVAAFVGTNDTSYEADPPASRIRFFAITAIPANAIFLMIVVLDGVASIFGRGCTGG